MNAGKNGDNPIFSYEFYSSPVRIIIEDRVSYDTGIIIDPLFDRVKFDHRAGF